MIPVIAFQPCVLQATHRTEDGVCVGGPTECRPHTPRQIEKSDGPCSGQYGGGDTYGTCATYATCGKCGKYGKCGKCGKCGKYGKYGKYGTGSGTGGRQDEREAGRAACTAGERADGGG